MEEDTRKRIIQKGWERFLAMGFSKVTMDEIADDLGISKKTLYKYFESKNDLIEIVIQQQLLGISVQVHQIVSADMEYVEKLNRLFTFLGNFISRIGKQFADDLQRTKPALWERIDQFRREKILVNIGNILEQGIQQGMFRKDLDKDVAMLMFLTAVPGVVNPDILSRHAFSAGEAFESMIGIFFEGVLTDEARERYRDLHHAVSIPDTNGRLPS